jgi:hypothetical protein
LLALYLLTACATSTPDEPAVSETPAADAGVEVPLLPPSMVGTYVPEDDTSSGRVLIVSTDMLAAVECAECGLPVYARLMRISCSDDANCQFETDQCNGDLVVGPGGTLAISTHPLEDATAACDAFAGSFVPGEMEGAQGKVVASSEAKPGKVLVGEIRSPHEVDLDTSRRIVEDKLESLDACYVAALADQPELSGEMELELVQGLPDNKNKRPRVSRTTVSAPNLETCVSDVLFELVLPGSVDGMPAPVYYTLSFVPR